MAKNPKFTRDEAAKLVYRTTHRDFKGTIEGMKTLLVYRKGTVLISIDDLTDKEIYDRLPRELRDSYYPNGVE